MGTCKTCGEPLEQGFVFCTKDGALSFADELPSALKNARHAPGFIELSSPQVGGRAAVAATICRACRKITIDY